LCGSVLGAAAARIYLHSRMPAQVHAVPAIEQARHVGLANLKKKLNLTPAQEQVVTKILDDYGKFYQNIEDEREDVAEYGRKRLLETLTPEQQERFNQMIGQKRR
jgi:Spy/CpxP family protein refolding chaperone